MKAYLVFGSLLVAAALVLLVQSATPMPKKSKGRRAEQASAEYTELLRKAEAAGAEGKFVEAENLVNKARHLAFRRPESYLVGAKNYLLAHNAEGAEKTLQKGLEAAGEDAALLIELASVELRFRQNSAGSLALLRRAQAVSPQAQGLAATMADVLATQAEQKLQAGDLAGAKTATNEALELDATSLAAQTVQARLAEREERWMDAVSAWEKIFSAGPSPEVRGRLAEGHKRLGYQKLVPKRDEAVVHFRRAVDLGAEGVDTTVLLEVLRQESDAAFEEGKKAFEAKNYARAKERFLYASSLVSDNYLADNHLGLALLKDGDREGAIAAWQSALAKAEKVGGRIEEAPTHKNLVLLLKEMGRFEEAKRVGESYLDKAPDGKFAKEIRALIGQ